MKNAKRHQTDGNQEKIKTLGEKETYKYFGIADAETIKQV